MKKLFFPLFTPMLIAIMCAATVRAADDQLVQRVITIKNGNRSGIMHTIKDLEAGTPVHVSTPDNDHIVLSGPKDLVAGFEEVIKQLDVPAPVKKDIETTVYIIGASTKPSDAPAPPADLDPVIKQLKAIVNYKGFHLLDSFVLRTRDGENGGTSGILPGGSYRYLFDCGRIAVDGSGGANTFRLDRVRMTIKGSSNDWTYATLSTDADIPEGKKVVIGKTSNEPDNALILVISAKVVD